jgi:hypothetical protein
MLEAKLKALTSEKSKLEDEKAELLQKVSAFVGEGLN